MAAEEEAFRRRVQHRLADRYLEALELEEENERRKQLGFDRDDSVSAKRKGKFSAFSVQNILWLMCSITVFHFSDFYLVVLYDHRINRLWFDVGAVLISVTLAIALFLIVWLSLVKKVSSEDWEKLHPAAIPIATASFILGSLCLLKGLWPVWGLLTPFILVSLFMGIVVLIAMCG